MYAESTGTLISLTHFAAWCRRNVERVQREQHDQIVGHPHDKYGLSGASSAAANMSAMEADAVASGLLDVRLQLQSVLAESMSSVRVADASGRPGCSTDQCAGLSLKPNGGCTCEPARHGPRK